MVTEFARINRRMHNKSFTADGVVSIVGGRNIGDEYFEADAEMNLADLDVAVIGPVVKEVSAQFDLYWNDQSSIPIAAVAHQRHDARAARRATSLLVAYHETREGPPPTRRACCATAILPAGSRSHSIFLPLGDGHDRRTTIRTRWPPPPAQEAERISPWCARGHCDKTEAAGLFLVSPYFVPGRKGVEFLAGVHQRGVRVVVITNSLASTDGIPVHSKYKLYRKALIEAGVELYEIKPTAGGQLKRRFREPAGSSTGGLHAKTFAFDRRIGFIGSYNLDPRSSKLNTEMGVLYDCPELAKRLPEQTERELSRNTYRVELDHHRLV